MNFFNSQKLKYILTKEKQMMSKKNQGGLPIHISTIN
jgi:hypothetical protein